MDISRYLQLWRQPPWTKAAKARMDILESGTDEEGALGARVGNLENSFVGIDMSNMCIIYVSTRGTPSHHPNFTGMFH